MAEAWIFPKLFAEFLNRIRLLAILSPRRQYRVNHRNIPGLQLDRQSWVRCAPTTRIAFLEGHSQLFLGTGRFHGAPFTDPGLENSGLWWKSGEGKMSNKLPGVVYNESHLGNFG